MAIFNYHENTIQETFMKPFLNSERINQIKTHELKITNPWEEQKTVS